MPTETYNAIMRHQDQFIASRTSSYALHIAMLADNREAIEAVVGLARGAGLRVKKNIVGKGDPDAEMHLAIR